MKDVKVIELCDIDDGKRYSINVELPMNTGWVDDIYFVVLKGNNKEYYPLKHIRNTEDKIVFGGEIDLNTSAIYRYYIEYKVNDKKRFIKKEEHIKDGIINDEMFKMSVNFDTPDWAKGKIMYHIFVDRFNRGSTEELKEMDRRTIHKSFKEDMIIGPDKNGIWNADFYGGDLKGIEDKLDYIKSLGVSIIYLSPIVHSQSNHRYDTSDYENVDPYVGCNDDLKKLCDIAHKKGMRVILDAVFNHTGNDSKYFNEYGSFDTIGAYQSSNSPYSSFYRKHRVGDKEYFDYWWGMTNLPVCDGYSKDWQNYILGEGGIIDKWFSLGIDGLRLDVADELTDDFIEKIRTSVKRNKEDGFILGEVWKNPMRMNRGYIESGKGMDSVMNYQLVDALIRYFKYNDVDKLAYIIRDIKNEYPDSTINTLMNFTSTHDISRAINIFGTDEFNPYSEWAWNLSDSDLERCKKFKMTAEQYKYGKEIYKAYIFTLTFMPGILSIFYGDEVGVEGLGNLMNRKPFPWDNIDNDLLEYFRYIGKIREEESFLEEADLNIVDINDRYLMFERESKLGSALVTINRTSDDTKFYVPSSYEKEKVYTLNRSKKGILTPYGAVAIIKK